jgi:hypothetical protein
MKVWVEGINCCRKMQIIGAIQNAGYEACWKGDPLQHDVIVLLRPCKPAHRVTAGVAIYNQHPPVIIYKPRHHDLVDDMQDDFCKATVHDVGSVIALLIGMATISHFGSRLRGTDDSSQGARSTRDAESGTQPPRAKAAGLESRAPVSAKPQPRPSKRVHAHRSHS